MTLDTLGNHIDASEFAMHVLGFTPDPQQSRVLESESARVILNCTRQWGKSTVCAAKAVHVAFNEPNGLVLVASPSARQSAEFVRKASAFLRKLGIRPRGDGDNEISLLLPNNSRIVGIPGIEATVRGFSAVSLMLIDEASRVPDELYRALRPMLAVGGGSLWLLSTPYGKRGFFYNEWTTGEEWTRLRIPAPDCPRIPAAFLEQERRALGPRYFSQEYLCEFHSTNDSLFSEPQVRHAIKADIAPLFATNTILSRTFIHNNKPSPASSPTSSAASTSSASTSASAATAPPSPSSSAPSSPRTSATPSPSSPIAARDSPSVTWIVCRSIRPTPS